MEIIAKTNNGVLINASDDEINEILNAVTGEKPQKLTVGMRIPAIDYASTIKKVQTLGKEYSFKQLKEYSKTCAQSVEELFNKIDLASKITL